jgi:hypothetical protein
MSSPGRGLEKLALPGLGRLKQALPVFELAIYASTSIRESYTWLSLDIGCLYVLHRCGLYLEVG